MCQWSNICCGMMYQVYIHRLPCYCHVNALYMQQLFNHADFKILLHALTDRWIDGKTGGQTDRQTIHCLTYLYMHVKCKNTSRTCGILFEVLSPAASSF